MGKICKDESCDVELTEETRYKDRALCTTHGKAMMRAQGWQERALTAERRHYNLIEKNRKAKAAKKPAKKAGK